MRGMAIVFFSLFVTGSTQASSLVYFSDTKPASTPSVAIPVETGRDADTQSVRPATDQMSDNPSVVVVGEAHKSGTAR